MVKQLTGDTLYTYFKYVVLYDSDICTHVVDTNLKNARCSLVVHRLSCTSQQTISK